MFKKYQIILDEAKVREQEIETENDGKIKKNALEIQKRMSDEVSKMSKDVLLKNYNPIEYYNEITKLKHAYDKLIKEKASEIEALKREVDSKIVSLTINFDHVKEIYKVLPCNGGNYLCFVYFTLIGDKHAKSGDPIRVRFVYNNSEHFQPGQQWPKYSGQPQDLVSGTQKRMPNMCSHCMAVNGTSLVNFDQFGENSQQRKWWLEWVKTNRPIPE